MLTQFWRAGTATPYAITAILACRNNGHPFELPKAVTALRVCLEYLPDSWDSGGNGNSLIR